MWDFFIRNDRFSYLFLVALLAVGSYSLISIPKESAPEVVIPVGVVTVSFPGAPALDVESLITNEIERGLTSLEDVKEITSTSREGLSSVVVEFEAEADIDSSIQDLKDRISVIERDFPDDANDAVVSEVNFVDQPILTVALAATLSDFAFTELADQLEKEIENISGVSRVEFEGVRDREVTILVDHVALSRYNLTLTEVVNSIRSANLTFPIGQIEHDGITYNVAFEGDIKSTSAIEQVPIANKAGQPVYVRDIAVIEDGLAPAQSLSRLSVTGTPSQNSVTLNVYKQSGGDITRLSSAVLAKLTELQQPNSLLDGIEVVSVLDAGEQINKDLINLTVSGLQTVVLVVLLLVLTIGWREGLLAGTSVPLSFLFGFIGLYFSGNTINFLSLFSLILGIGILVDAAIVMVEGINRKMKEHPTIDKKQAAIETIREFAIPLISGALTTVAMFVGLFIVSGIIGQFIASIPFTLIFLLFAAQFVALAIVPLLAASFLHRRSTSTFEVKQIHYARRLEKWYIDHLTPFIVDETTQRSFLAFLFAALVFALSLTINVFAGLVAAPLVYVLSHQVRAMQQKRLWPNWKRNLVWYPSVAIVIGVVFYVVATILPSYNPVKVTFFEQSDVDYVIIELEQPEGTTKEVTDIATRRVEEFLYDEPDIASFSVTVGRGSEFGSGGSGSKFSNIFVNLEIERERTSTEIVEHLRQELSTLTDLAVTVSQPSDGPPTGAAIVVKFLGDDMREITRLANEAAVVARETPHVVNVETSTNNNGTEFVLDLDTDKAAAYGLDPLTVSQTLRTAVYGTEATSLNTLAEDIGVIVRMNLTGDRDISADSASQATIDILEQLNLPSLNGPVPVAAITTTHLRESSSIITHEDGQRMVSITADVTSDANAREVQATILEKIKAELTIPNDVTISTGGGETEESNKAFLEMLFALVVGVLLMVGILVLQFNSYLHMRYVLSILPYSLIGVLGGLALTMNPLSFPSIMGFIALSGIVVNNSILLIDVMNRARQADPTRPLKDVILTAAASRLRPILLTSLTTVIGMIPLTYAGDMWAPLAYAVMFGLIFSVLITLIFVPLLYSRKPGEIHQMF
jgi:multidrug efflux pump subunit AcrB